MKKIKNNIVNVVRDPDTSTAQKQKEEQHKKYLDLHQSSIYNHHRQFLNDYKTANNPNILNQRSKMSQEQKNSKKYDEKEEVNESIHQQKMLNENHVQDAMNNIHQKVIKDLLGSKDTEEKNVFKIFTTKITNKKDIQRINKEKRFIKSTSSKRYTYDEPKMTNFKNLSKQDKSLRIYLDQNQLKRNAKQFSEKVQKEQEKLWGLHLLHKKREEEKKQLQQKLQKERIKLKRQKMILEKYKIPQQKVHFLKSRVLQRSKTQQSQKRVQEIPRQTQTNEFLDSSRYDPRIIKQHSQPLQKIFDSDQSISQSCEKKRIMDFKISKPRRFTVSRNTDVKQTDKNLQKVNISINYPRNKNSDQGSNKRTEKRVIDMKNHNNSILLDSQNPSKRFQRNYPNSEHNF